MKSVQALNHIGIAVRSISEQIPFYRDVLGLEYEAEETIALQNVRVAFFRIGSVRVELLEPTDPESALARFLEKRGEGLHHIAYTVEDLASRIEELKREGIRMIDAEPRPGAQQMKIAFLHPGSTHGVLTELCEPAGDQG
ncbi:MAG TPA: methylmalonyl-CoA epimerase [Acidobacteriota bacterium]|nr:methylmalonyl-CoA epimerase [Acidobacteriota bacterium]